MKKETKTIRDPLYTWLAAEVSKEFSFLEERFGFQGPQERVNARGCWLTYENGPVAVQIWTEMGGRPEIDILRSGKRSNLNHTISNNFPESALPSRPVYSGIEEERRDFQMVLSRYAALLEDQADLLLTFSLPETMEEPMQNKAEHADR